MPNPIKGEVLIKISGKEFPLVFNYDAIAKIEAKYDASILVVQEDMSRIEKIGDLLEAALNGAFTLDKLKSSELPPILVMQGLLQEALHMAYFGNETPKEDKSKKPKKKTNRQKR